jgi:uncharacterized protein YfbU (UPF0304 family)
LQLWQFNDYSSLGKLLKTNLTLEKLEIIPVYSPFGNNLLGEIENSIEYSSLTSLTIKKMLDECIPNICSILEKKSCLKSCEFEFKELRENEFISILHSLSMNKSLETFTCNPIIDTKSMVDLLRNNYTLKEIHCSFESNMYSDLNEFNISQKKKFNHFRRFVTHFSKQVINIQFKDIKFHWE